MLVEAKKGVIIQNNNKSTIKYFTTSFRTWIYLTVLITIHLLLVSMFTTFDEPVMPCHYLNLLLHIHCLSGVCVGHSLCSKVALPPKHHKLLHCFLGCGWSMCSRCGHAFLYVYVYFGREKISVQKFEMSNVYKWSLNFKVQWCWLNISKL